MISGNAFAPTTGVGLHAFLMVTTATNAHRHTPAVLLFKTRTAHGGIRTTCSPKRKHGREKQSAATHSRKLPEAMVAFKGEVARIATLSAQPNYV